MFNVTFIRLKDLVKILFITIFIVLIVIFVEKIVNNKKRLELVKPLYQKVFAYVKKSIEIPAMNYILNENNKEINQNKNEEEIYNQLLELEFSGFNFQTQDTEIFDLENDNVSINDEVENTEEEQEIEEPENTKEEKLELAEKNVKTEVVTENPIANSYTNIIDGVKIKNETKLNISEDFLNKDNLKIDKSNIIIFHTHTCESYTSSKKYSYNPTGKFRTTDLNYSVARVGDELTNYLEQYKINIIHDTTYHDYPSYNGSYTRSLSTVSNLLKSTKADIIIDLHRDAIGSYSSYAPTVKIGDDYCAQLMFVMGSNGGGLYHPNWKNNLNFAFNLQKIANDIYPGLFKPIILRNSRYNQHLGKASCIIEVGSTGNTLEQCLNSMKYLSEIINEF